MEMETETASESQTGQIRSVEMDASADHESTDDLFKKPVLFVAPSSIKKPRSKPTVTDTDESSVNPKESKDTGGDKQPEPDSTSHSSSSKEKIDTIPAKSLIPGKFPPLPYTEPSWGSVPSNKYSFELVKNGAILDTVPLSVKSYFVVGRLPVCDMSLEHPSISRYHAVLQYRGREEQDAVGFYVFDLGSTHGTFVNKNKVPAKTYIRVRVGHVLKFGGSTRLFILQGPESDEEAESDLTVTELRELGRKKREELERRMNGDDKEEEVEGEASTTSKTTSEDVGCSWGMAEEAAPEEDENEENPFAMEFHEDQEAAYLKDPKKALQGFYDREGEELEFEYEDKGHGTWLCRIKLPVDDSLGKQLVSEVTHIGKKKEAAVQCCLDACRVLEARGLLRQEAVSRKRRRKNWEDEDFYDSDDDTFLDRTGAVEKKRTDRMKKAGKIQESPDTYESLLSKLAKVEKEKSETEKQLNISNKDASSFGIEDTLDAFMSTVKGDAAMDAIVRKKLHVRIAELKKEGERLRKLVELTKPTELPSLQSSGNIDQSKDAAKTKTFSLPLTGAMKGGSKYKLKTGTLTRMPPKLGPVLPDILSTKESPANAEEVEEEDEEKERMEDTTTQVITQNLQTTETEKDKGDQPAEMVVSTEREKPTSSSFQDKIPPVSEETKSASASKVQKTKKKVIGPKRPPISSKQYPEDDPDYCVWLPPVGQTGDGRTHLNEKYGY